jgi:hypothetical protein
LDRAQLPAIAQVRRHDARHPLADEPGVIGHAAGGGEQRNRTVMLPGCGHGDRTSDQRHSHAGV